MRMLFLAVCLAGLAALSGCGPGGGGISAQATVQQGGAGVVQVGAQQYAYTNMVSVDGGIVKAYSVCLDPIPRSSNCTGAVVVHSGYCILRCGTAFIPIQCFKDPSCRQWDAVGGFEQSLVTSLTGMLNFNIGIGGGTRINNSNTQSQYQEQNTTVKTGGGGKPGGGPGGKPGGGPGCSGGNSCK